MSGDDFLEELKRDFVNEALFMMEQYEESMLALESAVEPQEHIGKIFRVAHSIKGGAAAVGFEDLSHFAHKAEDLLSILRIYPEKITTEIITLFLSVGDQFKNRLKQLQTNDTSGWDVTDLSGQLKHWIEHFQATTNASNLSESCVTPEVDMPASMENKMDDLFFPTETPASVAVEAAPAETEDVTNYELLAELEAQIAAQEQQKETPKLAVIETAVVHQPSVEVVAETVVEAKPVEAPLKVVSSAAPAAVASASAKAAQSGDGGAKKATQENQVLKVDSTRVDAVLDVVGEIVVLKNQLIHSDAIRSGVDQRLNFIVDQLDKSIRDLYEKTLGIRMTPLRSLFMKLQRTVRDVSVKLQKPVDLQLLGEDTEVDRSVFELLGDPLMHMARNAMDHGIEPKEDRKAANKPEMAKLTISAKQVGGSVLIEIAEDGRGIDREKILKKAREKNLISADINTNEMSNEQVYQFLFAPGFSTAEVVTDLSGRGVGLDVVRSNIEKIKGNIRIKSELGKGTTFQISIPLTTAITDGIVVAIMGNNYMIPIHSIREIVQFTDDEVTEVANVGQVLKIRDRLTPILNLERALSMVRDMNLVKSSDTRVRSQKTYVVLESSQGLTALLVDDVVGQSQVVAKPLQVGHNVPEFSGAATLGDGRTILILEPNALAQSATRSNKEAA